MKTTLLALAAAAAVATAVSFPVQAQKARGAHHTTPTRTRAHAPTAHARARAHAPTAAPVPISASGPNVRPQDPSSVVRALQANNRAAKLGADAVGDPMITTSFNGTTYQLFFYNCTDHKACATVQFHSGYHLPAQLPLETVNEWNRSQRFGRAYLDKENDPILEMDVDLDDGGVAPLLFIDNVEFWESILPKFETHIGYRK